MKIKSKIKLLFILITLALTIQNCYTHVEMPNYKTPKKQSKETNRLVNFTYTVIDTFNNAWFPDKGYYYEFRFDIKKIREDKIDLFLNMLYTKGYNVLAAWYRPAIYDCHSFDGPITMEDPNKILSPKFIILLSDFDDSIIEHNLYPLMTIPIIVCPYNIEEYWIE
jgi:hypothetical protein